MCPARGAKCSSMRTEAWLGKQYRTLTVRQVTLGDPADWAHSGSPCRIWASGGESAVTANVAGV